MKEQRYKKPRPPLDAGALERSALFYVGRYATTRARLRAFLDRKLKERGWAGEGTAPSEALVERFVQLGYVDDSAFALARAASLGRRGFGERRVGQALYAAGIADADAAGAKAGAREGAFTSALHFARRKRLGPYAEAAPDREARQKAFAAMMRAGHPVEIARRVLALRPGEIPDEEEM